MKKHFFLLLGIILFGAALRFTAVNWDSYLSFHPDERNIAWAVTRIHFFDQLNPKFFAYGGLPVYLYRALGELAVWITKNPAWLSDWGHISVIGRHVSATLSTISILLIFLVGRTYFSARAGLLAAFLLAVSPWAIREAHFSTTETMLVFYLLLLSWLSSKLSLEGPILSRLQGILLLGIVQGIALGAKTTSLLFMLIPLTALALPIISYALSQKSIQKALKDKTFHQLIVRTVGYGCIFLLVSCLLFLVTSPYTILDFSHFRESMEYETGVALGRFTVPYTLSFLGTPPYLYQLTTMLWQAGIVPILGFLGMGVLLLTLPARLIQRFMIQNLKSKSKILNPKSYLLILLIFPLVYFAWNGMWLAKFSRYNVPLFPFLTLFASWLLIRFAEHMKKQKHGLFISQFVTLSICCISLMWGLANFSIYLHPQTRIAASEWIYTHIPAGSVIFTEHWNDGLPVSLPNVAGKAYIRELLTVYDADTPEKAAYYDRQLARGDYIILSTRRVATSMQHARRKYPITSLFYDNLFNGSLGYEEVATFTRYPTILGITLPDELAEESIQVFDHPTVRIFQNTKRIKK